MEKIERGPKKGRKIKKRKKTLWTTFCNWLKIYIKKLKKIDYKVFKRKLEVYL